MKYIIIGLGNFGTTLCTSLTAMGHEVIGVDKDMQKVNQVKDRVTHGICLDSSDMHAITTLPLKDADIVIVCIGEDIGASILTTAILKQHKVKKAHQPGQLRHQPHGDRSHRRGHDHQPGERIG
jgi:trk system potassium uptake protein TrkA